MKKIVFSPPFSNISPRFYSIDCIVGTYTLKRRKGLHRVITTLRKIKNGWINNVGLKNPGITRFKKKDVYVSISLEKESEWIFFKKILKNKKKKYRIKGIEFNISCPNHKVSNVSHETISDAKKIFKTVIIKLPHNINKSQVKDFISLEADYLHISNSKKTDIGAKSGKDLIENNVKIIKFIKMFSDQKVIAGGGIYSFKDFIKYKDAGADVFSLSTRIINPIKTYFLVKKMLRHLK